jgi:hypothetical protein
MVRGGKGATPFQVDVVGGCKLWVASSCVCISTLYPGVEVFSGRGLASRYLCCRGRQLAGKGVISGIDAAMTRAVLR